MLDYNSNDTAVQGPPAVEAGCAAGSASAEPQCWSSRPGCAKTKLLRREAASRRHLVKPGSRFSEIPSILLLLMLRDLSSKAPHLDAGDPARVR